MAEHPNKSDSEAPSGCGLSRWQLLKARLNNLSAQNFHQAIGDHPDAVLLDCRTEGEFLDRPLSGATNLDYFSDVFYEQLEQLDKESVYLVYCRSGRRSLRVCTLMQNSGFEKVFNLEGGLVDWDQHFSR